MFKLWLGLALGLWATAAWAADKPVFGQPAPWVKPLETPRPPEKLGAAAARVLLADVQLHFGPDGEEIYSDNVLQVQTPEGLAGAGNIGLSWNPDIDVLTIHKVHIIRDGQVIDVLARGQAFTVLRRENNLERAMLDGVLTAALQVEGLQVGDLLDLAYTIRRKDPAMQGWSEEILRRLGDAPIGRLRFRAVWPKGAAIRWRETAGLAPPRLTGSADGKELVIDASDVQPLLAVKDAPGRFNEVGQLELSQFDSWSEVSALMAPLYVTAATLAADSPLKAEAARIRSLSSDPKIRAAAALRLVQDKVRYEFLGMNDGGYVPAPADLTWTRLFGDCKGKTALLLALLHELGIEAQPAFVSSTHGDGLDARLPMVRIFDHVLVRAVIGGKVYWMDGADAGARALDDLPIPPFRWALPVQPHDAKLEQLLVPPLDKPASHTSISLDASAGLEIPAPAHIELTLRGAAARAINAQLGNLTPANLETGLRDYWRKQYDWIEVRQVKAVFDDASGEEHLSMDGSAKMAWSVATSGESSQYEADGGALGWKPDFSRDPGPGQDAPFALDYPSFNDSVETIVLPNGGAGFTVIGADVAKTVAGYEFKRTSGIHQGVFTMAASTRAILPEIAAADARASAADLTDLSKVTVYVRAPVLYRPTDQEVAKRESETLTTAESLVDRGNLLMSRGDNDRALADFEKAVQLDPKSSVAVADRGMARLNKGNLDGASADFDKALQLDPRQVVAFHGRGLLYMRDKQYPKAREAFNRALEISPQDLVALFSRASVNVSTGDFDKALEDLHAAQQIDPRNDKTSEAISYIYSAKGQFALALAEIDKLVALKPESPSAYVLKGRLLASVGRTDEAIKAYGAAITLEPSAESYLARAALLRDGKRADALADVEQALRLDPRSIPALEMLAGLHLDAGDTKAALADLEGGLRAFPANQSLMRELAYAYQKVGRLDDAERTMDAVVGANKDDPDVLNARCWLRAISNRALDGALQDCNAALGGAPGTPAYLDSRGLVELRMGRYDQSIADYDSALKLRPKSPASLFGRGVAKLRKGAKAEGEADLAAARTLDPKIDAEFTDYGVKP